MPKTERKSNFELMRIICMFLIVLGHACYYSTFALGKNYSFWMQGSNINKVFASFLFPFFGDLGNGIFFMLFGYFNCEKNSVSRISKVIKEVCYYALITCVIMVCASHIVTLDMIDMLRMVLNPVSGSNWWFATVYVLIALMSPFFNSEMKKMSNKELICFLAFAYIFWYIGGKFGSPYENLLLGIFYYIFGSFCQKIKRGGDIALI